MKQVAASEQGRLMVEYASGVELAPLIELVRRGLAVERAWLARVELAGRAAWFKGGHLRGKTRWRHGLCRALGLCLPRQREHRHLDWLRERLFQAPRPLASGVLVEHGLPRFQFLVSEHVEGARPFGLHFAQAPPAERRELIDELARELARLHALGFQHRDLYPRNVLVAPGARRLWFLDAWAGGPDRWPSSAARDLGAWMLEGAELFQAEECARFFAHYADERLVQDRPIELATFLGAVARERERELARVLAQPHRWRLATPPAPHWEPPSLSG